ncbi:MAG: hypothetical protein NXH97_23040 [Rhodobacteraceae bacterium]|nr:hypothetical protein [Paracoccaceae bacterium]
MTTPQLRLALVHATRLAMEPIEDTVTKLWPDVETFSLLDENLEIDRAKSEELSSDLRDRINPPARHAAGFGADGGSSPALCSARPLRQPTQRSASR